MLRTEKIEMLSRTIHKHKVRSENWNKDDVKNAFNRFLPVAYKHFPKIGHFISQIPVENNGATSGEIADRVLSNMSKAKLIRLRKELEQFHSTIIHITPFSPKHEALFIKSFSGFTGHAMRDIARDYSWERIIRDNLLQLKPKEAVTGHLLYRNYRREQQVRGKYHNLCKYLHREVSSRIDRR